MSQPVITQPTGETVGNGCCPDCHRILAELEPYLPLLARAAALLDNPAARFRARIRGGKDE